MTGLRDQSLPATCVAGFFIIRSVTMTNFQPDKPFKTYQEQINLLQQKYGLIINNSVFAEIALRNFTYYDLVNGYKDCFMINEKYKPNVSLEMLYMFFMIDRNIQSILFKYSAMVENAFKSKLAYIISANFGVTEAEYLNPNNYNRSHNGILLSDVIASCNAIKSNISNIPQPTKHYALKHNHIPAWILFKNLSFSNSINLFQLLKSKEKKETANLLYGNSKLPDKQKISFVIDALTTIRKYRNKIAHNLKFVTFKNYRNPLAPKVLTKIIPYDLLTWRDINKNNRGVNDIYSFILCLFILLEDPLIRAFFISELNDYFSGIESSPDRLTTQCCQEYYKITNLPPDITKRFTNYLTKRKR